MTSLDPHDPLERTLREALRADAERAPQLPMEWIAPSTSSVTDDWIDVALVPLESEDDQPVGQPLRPAWTLVAAAAVVAIVVAALVLVTGDDDPSGEVPAEQPTMSDRLAVVQSALFGVGFVGLPPLGAQPSTPERGHEVLSLSPCPSMPRWAGVSVYDNGRLIWGVSGRLVEQRLTPEGVELMRSALISSGLLVPDEQECEVGGYFGRLPGVGDGQPSFFTTPDNELTARLMDPASWLPASAWDDREIKAFVPSEYSIIILGGSPDGLARELPATAQELVRDRRWECQGGGSDPDGFRSACYAGFTTDEARALAGALEAAGFKADVGHDPEPPNKEHLRYRVSEESLPRIDLYPRLPQEVGAGPLQGD